MSIKSETKFSTQLIVEIALFCAIKVVLDRFLSINLPFLRIGIGFLPVLLAGIRLGALPTLLVAGLSDFLGAVLFPYGPYFPGFTLTACIMGWIYGSFYHKNLSWKNIILGIFLIQICCSLLLNSFWISWLSGNPYFVSIGKRLVSTCVDAAIRIAVLVFFKYNARYLSLLKKKSPVLS